MEHSAFINLDILSKEAREELRTFYEFLLFKSKKKGGAKKIKKKDRFGEFLSHPIKVDGFQMIGREERNER